jgi:SAM-dependent methyltransferase
VSSENSYPQIEDAVRLLYEAYPYPAANAGTETLPELAALLQMFFLENKVRPQGGRVLDIGTGSGNRLLGAAERIPALRFTGVDFSAASIAMARRLQEHLGLAARGARVEFFVGDILDDAFAATLGADWDFVTCMGVLHHIPRRADALTRLRRLLAPNGYLFLYVYGTLGSADRLLTKELIRLLRSDLSDREDGLAVAKALGASITGYGWQTSLLTRSDAAIAADEATRDISVVDALLHDYETTFTVRQVADELGAAGFDWFAVTGVTVDDRAYLVECDWRPDSGQGKSAHTVAPAIASSPFLLERYRRLPTLSKLEVIEKLYKPNGYSIVAGRTTESAGRLGRRLTGARVDLAGRTD